MKYMVDKPLRDFEFWSGAVDTAKQLDDDGFEKVEEVLEQMQQERIDCGSEPMTDTEINDMFWFDSNTIFEWAGVFPKYCLFKSLVNGNECFIKLQDEDEVYSFESACSKYSIEYRVLDKDEYPDESIESVYEWDASNPKSVFWEEDRMEYSYEIPASWPSVIENDDFTGVSDEEETQIRDFMDEIAEYRDNPDDYECIWDVEDTEFEMPDFGDGRCNCVTYRIYDV